MARLQRNNPDRLRTLSKVITVERGRQNSVADGCARLVKSDGSREDLLYPVGQWIQADQPRFPAMELFKQGRKYADA